MKNAHRLTLGGTGPTIAGATLWCMESDSGQVVLQGRFLPGTHVRLVKVAGEHVARPEGAEHVASARADEHGTVRFREGVEVGGRYFAVAQEEGIPREVRARGVAFDDPSAAPQQPPLAPVRRRKIRPVASPPRGPAPYAGQEDVPPGTPQRSETARGMATPVDGAAS